MMHPKVLRLVLVPSIVWISVTACDRPGNPAKGIKKHFTWKESFEEGDFLEYECIQGYDIVPWSISYRRTCINGSWSGQLPVCARLYLTRSMPVCNTSETTTCFDMPYCLTLENKHEFWKIILDKQYHVSAVDFDHEFSPCEEGDYYNISISNNSTTRYFDSKRTSSYFSPDPCPDPYFYYMEDNSSPLTDTINIAINNLPADQVTRLCNIRFYGNEVPADCGQPDSPLYSVVTYSNDNRTAFFECKSGYRAVGDNLVSHCTDDLRWTKLDMKCIEHEELPPMDTQTGVNDLQLSFMLTVIPLGLLFCVFSVVNGKILYRRWQKRREQQDLIEELQRMKENRRVALNPDVPLDEQSDLLSYNQRWEFPKERLKLGKCIGEGAFGTVVKAEAIDIIAGESRTTVAVKMVKCQDSKEHLKALLTELKILAYIGHHINIVNLLGAVTKNLAKGELMVITEYCEFGNMRKFLLCQRDRFINQIDPETGDLTSDFDALPKLSSDDDEKDQWASRQRSKKFLHAMLQLVHRDLAARNVLVAESKLVKICDFGLSRKTYEENAYVRKGKGLLPIKWMAIESICDRVFTSKSDVWSFGVLLWEIFTLGADPYPGVECNEQFYYKLKGGYRLKKPDLAPNALHNIMQQAWQENPKTRPTFTEIAEMLGNLLQESVRSYYLDLNVPHSQFNEAMARDMQLESTMVSDSSVIGEDAVSEIRESDVKSDPLVCVDVNADVEKQIRTDLASQEESNSANAGSCETTKL